MFPRGQRHLDWRGNTDAEYVLQIGGDARRVTIAPKRKNFKTVTCLPRSERQAVRGETGFFPKFPQGRLLGRFPRLQTAGNGLPIVDVAGTLKQQHLKIGRMDDDKNGFWILVHGCNQCVTLTLGRLGKSPTNSIQKARPCSRHAATVSASTCNSVS